MGYIDIAVIYIALFLLTISVIGTIVLTPANAKLSDWMACIIIAAGAATTLIVYIILFTHAVWTTS